MRANGDASIQKIDSVDGMDDKIPIKSYLLNNDVSKVYDLAEDPISIAKCVTNIEEGEDFTTLEYLEIDQRDISVLDNENWDDILTWINKNTQRYWRHVKYSIEENLF